MRRIIPVVALACIGAALAACGDRALIEEKQFGGAQAMMTTADVRMVTARPAPLRPGQTVFCAEPSPDVAKALSTAASISAQGGDGTVTAQAGAAFARAEALTELAGRTTALVALRDGLFRTCEAYANGAIGDAAYALVLSRYGQLMVTLFLGQNAQGAAAPTLGAALSPPLLLQLPGQPQGGQGAGDAQSKQPGGGGANPAVTPAADKLLTPVKNAAPAASGQTGKTGTTPNPVVSGMSASAAIASMQSAYIALDTNPMALEQLKMVVCINELDSTRASYGTSDKSSPLASMCQNALAQAAQRSPAAAPQPAGQRVRR